MLQMRYISRSMALPEGWVCSNNYMINDKIANIFGNKLFAFASLLISLLSYLANQLINELIIF